MKKESARGIVIDNNRVLLIYREKNGECYYSIPGGKVEKDETPSEATVREIREESGITVTINRLLIELEDKTKEKRQFLFLCNYIKRNPIIDTMANAAIKMEKDSKNLYKPEWVNFVKAQQLPIRPDIAQSFFKQYILNGKELKRKI